MDQYNPGLIVEGAAYWMSNEEQSKPVVSTPALPRRLRVVSFANFLARHDRVFNVLSTTITAIFTVVC
jgi:hypothetical protein